MAAAMVETAAGNVPVVLAVAAVMPRLPTNAGTVIRRVNISFAFLVMG